MSDEFAIELDQLSKRFGARTAVNEVSLRVPRGVVYGLVGPNGAGKTTLMRTMLGFTPASGGTVRVLGHAMPTERAAVYPRVGVIIEEPRFYPFLTGRENLDQIVAAHRTTITPTAVDAALHSVDLTDRAGDRVKTYSLGMRQRLGIARTMLGNPDLLVLDEPSNGLDPAGIRDMRVLLRSLAEQGRTVFVSSHILSEMEQLCDFVAVLKDGSVIADGPVADLVSGVGTGGGDASRSFLFGVHDVNAARAAMAAANVPVHDGPDHMSVIVKLSPTAGDADLAGLNAHLVAAGVGVHRIQPFGASLEERFMDITASPQEAVK